MIKAPFSGGCLCGNIRYECRLTPKIMYYCHCDDCRKANGSAYHVGVYLPHSGFRVTKGELKEFAVIAESGNSLVRYFCGDCGSQVYTDNGPASDMVSVKAGTLDDPSGVTPKFETWAQSKISWAEFPRDLKSFPRGIEG